MVVAVSILPIYTYILFFKIPFQYWMRLRERPEPAADPLPTTTLSRVRAQGAGLRCLQPPIAFTLRACAPSFEVYF